VQKLEQKFVKNKLQKGIENGVTCGIMRPG